MFGKRTLTILAATRHAQALALLAACDDVEIAEALTTDGAYRLLEKAALAVVDEGDLAEGSLSREGLRVQLKAAGLPHTSGQDFAARPDHWLDVGRVSSGRVDALPPKVVAIANVSGGVGKTTLCLDLARYVRAKLRLSALVVELGFGASAFQAITGAGLVDFYDIVTQNAEPSTWQGVSLVPMRWDTARLTLADTARVQARLAALSAAHVLTLFDANPAHPLWPAALELVDEVLLVATSRPDTLHNAIEAMMDILV